MILCAAGDTPGDVHGAIDRLYSDVLASETSLATWKR